ncbi:MAG: hypothetical protein NHB14_20770 [Desulfosporosinus sp.]|nr:hypothetical protein [Desulfosporosinus sp.]
MSFYNNDVTLRTTSVTGAREIKASAHYTYITGGATLDGSKFAVGELLLEGQCLAKNDATGKYEKYPGDDAGPVFKAGYSNPVVLDESIKFVPTDAGTNPDVTFGQGMVHGAVYSGMCIGLTAPFKAAFAGSVRFL